MNRSHLLIITSGRNSGTVDKVITAATSQDWICSVALYEELVFNFSGSQLEITYRGQNILEYDYFILRSIHKNKQKQLLYRYLVARHLLDHQKPTINGRHYVHFRGGLDKLAQTQVFQEHAMPYVPTWASGSHEVFSHSLDFPVIAKKRVSSSGKHVVKLDTQAAFDSFVATIDLPDYVFQPYVPLTFDYRVLVLGAQVLGVIKRYNSAEDFRTNVVVNHHYQLHDPDDALSEVALKAARVCLLDYVGVDIVEFDNQLQVLEINDTAAFKGVQTALGISVGEKIVDYLKHL